MSSSWKTMAKGLNVNVHNAMAAVPLHEAVLNNQEEATVILLDAKASLDADRQRNSPLHLGVANGHYYESSTAPELRRYRRA